MSETEIINFGMKPVFKKDTEIVYGYYWASVKDCLPRHNQFVLAFGKDKNIKIVRCDLHTNGNVLLDYVFMAPDLRHQVTGITHWMPLPEIPNE